MALSSEEVAGIVSELGPAQAAFIVGIDGEINYITPEANDTDVVPLIVLALMEKLHGFKSKDIPVLAKKYLARSKNGVSLKEMF